MALSNRLRSLFRRTAAPPAPPRTERPPRRSRPPSSPPPTAARPVTLRDVSLAYTPTPDGDADPGEVVWTWVPYEDDPRQGKDRPVLVIGHCDGVLAAVPLTSKPHGRRDEIELGSGAWDRSGRPSFVKLDRILLVTPRAVRREGATLDRARFEQVLVAVQRYESGR
jgi:hypothetical protein